MANLSEGSQAVLLSGSVEIRLEHKTMTMETGQPAYVAKGEAFPQVHICSEIDAAAEVNVIYRSSNNVVAAETVPSLRPGEIIRIRPDGTAEEAGEYIVDIKLTAAGEAAVYETFAFTVPDDDRAQGQSEIAYIGAGNGMVYVPDYRGNRICDFSNCGYGGGGVRIPDVSVKAVVEPVSGDATALVQQAIDAVSALPLDAYGFRGAVLLKRGTYQISGTLYIRAGGVVLRGEGDGEDGTILHASGAVRRDLLRVEGLHGPKPLNGTSRMITDRFVPSGSRSFRTAESGSFQPGDSVLVIRHGNDAWIHDIDMDTITPRPGSGGTKMWTPFDLEFDRVVTAVDGDLITLDAPISNSIDCRYGGGTIVKVDDSGRIEKVGIENLRVDSDFDPNVTDTQIDGKRGIGHAVYCADENHAANFVVFNFIKHAWLRNVTGFHLEHSLVTVDRYAKWVTVQDCRVRDMVSIITGGRRYAYHVTGQLSLVQRCDAETARHAFVVDARVAGPNVFLDCESRNDYNTSEPHHRWSTGGLYDCVKSPIHIRDRGWMGSGHGWAGANYVAWNTEGRLTVQKPPTAQNYAIGHVGPKDPPFLPNEHDRRPRQDGFWDHTGSHVHPRSLYMQQLKERLGQVAAETIR